jgi:hypothetical protein
MKTIFNQMKMKIKGKQKRMPPVKHPFLPSCKEMEVIPKPFDAL